MFLEGSFSSQSSDGYYLDYLATPKSSGEGGGDCLRGGAGHCGLSQSSIHSNFAGISALICEILTRGVTLPIDGVFLEGSFSSQSSDGYYLDYFATPKSSGQGQKSQKGWSPGISTLAVA